MVLGDFWPTGLQAYTPTGLQPGVQNEKAHTIIGAQGHLEQKPNVQNDKGSAKMKIDQNKKNVKKT